MSLSSVPAIVFRRLPEAFLPRPDRLTACGSSTYRVLPIGIWPNDFRIEHIRSKRTFDVFTDTMTAGYFWASAFCCSSGDGSWWSIGKSFGASAISFVLVDVTSMPSTYEVEKLAYDSSAMVELLLCSELLPTLARQFGATVISPIASDDVHFRRSSMAAGYNYPNREAKRENMRWIRKQGIVIGLFQCVHGVQHKVKFSCQSTTKCKPKNKHMRKRERKNNKRLQLVFRLYWCFGWFAGE